MPYFGPYFGYGPDSPDSVSWYYADQVDVEDLIHNANTEIVFDLNADGATDIGAVLRAGSAMDGYIDLKLRRAGFSAPNPLTDAAITAVLTQASAHLTVWYSFHQRGLDATTDGRLEGIAGIMEGYKAYADELLADVIEVLTLEDDDASTAASGSFGFVSITRNLCTADTDENSE